MGWDHLGIVNIGKEEDWEPWKILWVFHFVLTINCSLLSFLISGHQQLLSLPVLSLGREEERNKLPFLNSSSNILGKDSGLVGSGACSWTNQLCQEAGPCYTYMAALLVIPWSSKVKWDTVLRSGWAYWTGTNPSRVFKHWFKGTQVTFSWGKTGQPDMENELLPVYRPSPVPSSIPQLVQTC